METHRAASSSQPPSVSVILSAYNVAPFLKKAVDSALGQSFRDFEIIVVDDGSTDDCGEILAAVQDPRLHVIRQSNAGSAIARNRGIGAARGEYLAFLDGDDFWALNYLDRHLEILRDRPRIDLTFALCTIVDTAGAVRGVANVRRSGPVSFRELLVDNHIRCGSAVVVRSAAMIAAGCFDPALKACIDYDAWLRVLLLREGNAYCIGEPLVGFRRRQGQITSNWGKLCESHAMLLQKLSPLAGGLSRRDRTAAQSNMLRFCAYVAYESGSLAAAARLLRDSFFLMPLRSAIEPRFWLMLSAIAARLLLGANVHRRLENLAFALRSRLLMRQIVSRG